MVEQPKKLHASTGGITTMNNNNNTLPSAAKNMRSEGDASHITQLVVKLESDRKTIQVRVVADASRGFCCLSLLRRSGKAKAQWWVASTLDSAWWI